ncbi:MAG: glycosyltransferase family 4 protein [bacterium]
MTNNTTHFSEPGIKKILLIVTRLDKGGSAESTLYLARRLKERGHLVHLISGRTQEPETDLEAFAQQTGVPIVFLPCLRRNLNPFRDFLAFLKLLGLMKRIRPQIVHTHSSKAGILGRLAGWLLRVPVIVHTPHGHVFYGYFNRIKTKLFVLAERWAARFTDRIVALTERGKQEHMALGIASADKFQVIPCGISLQRFLASASTNGRIRMELGISDREFVIGWAGRLVPVKGCEIFLRAGQHVLRKFPEARLLIVGDGVLRKSLEALCVELGMADATLFAGMRTDMPEVLRAVDLFVHTSYNEGLGRVILEAMACGAPVIATAVGGVPDLIQPGRTGFLVPPGDVSELAEKIGACIRQKDRRTSIVVAARKQLPSFDVENMVSQVEALYREIWDSKVSANS